MEACTVGVSADVGGVVPWPLYTMAQLRNWVRRIVGIAVVVHHVGGRKFAHSDGQPPHVALAGDLVVVVEVPTPARPQGRKSDADTVERYTAWDS